MPMTSWDDIVGYCCYSCGRWATHWYGSWALCCACHLESLAEGAFMAQRAIEVNTRFQQGLPLSEEEPLDDAGV
jgi:hypothetical protein